MKNLIIFLFGAAVGVGGTLLWLRKDIQKELETIKKEAENSNEDEDLPFVMNDDDKPMATKENTKVDYFKIIDNEYTGVKSVPVQPREDNISNDDEQEDTSDFADGYDSNGVLFEIDQDDFMYDETYEKEHLIYFAGDKIMSTEAGTIIENPFLLVGGAWEQYVGNYAKNTSFVRNSRLTTDYEIFVEEGSYTDEYGPIDQGRED